MNGQSLIRRHRLLLAALPGVALGLTIWACGGDDDSGPAARPDGGSDVITNPDTGGGTDSGPPDVITDAGARDADASALPPSTPGQITCGAAANCDAGEAICCLEFPDSGATTACIPDTMACVGNQLPFDCDQRLDCGDGGASSPLCCMDIGLVGDPDIGGASCGVACGAQTVALCKTNAECQGTTCKSYNCKGYRIGVCGTLPPGLCVAE